MRSRFMLDYFFFFFNDTATTEIYTLSLHDALPILSFTTGDVGHTSAGCKVDLVKTLDNGDYRCYFLAEDDDRRISNDFHVGEDRKSTRLNSSHANISYAVFCLKKKKITSTTLISAN